MSTPADRVLAAHPRAGPAWYRAVARVEGRFVTLPGLRHIGPLARRAHAVTRQAGLTTSQRQPGVDRPSAATSLTVLSANLWHDWPRHQRWPSRVASFAELAESVDADILLLQEVARTPTLSADRWLADRLGFAFASTRANGALDAIGFEEGPAILSRFPISEVHVRQLTHGHNPLVRRAALAAHLETPFGPLLVVSAHLGLVQRHNVGQIRRLREWVGALTEDAVAIVGGDFNATELGAEMVETRRAWTDTFRTLHPTAEATTHTRRSRHRLGWLHRRLDYVFVQQPAATPWQVLECTHVDAPGGPHSDHRAVLVRIAPPETPTLP
jgi:endonuclease/exonuclease/phosphatase family metal-dependent hydrolase